jgi:hypothetical protein
MDLRGAQLRIVTAENSSSRLSVIDFSSADKPRVLGDLTGIAPFQRLYATRFDGDLAYVVTFRRVDPLHVISLKDPTDPRLVGELSVPGWSDFIYPHGDRLLAVGRGDGGQFVGVSYFDVSDPSRPFTIDQLQFGTPSAESEANLDHRGLTIAWDADPPYLVVPFSSVKWGKDSSQRRTCSATSALQLVEMGKLGLVKRGSLGAPAPVRRSFPVDDAQGNPTELISISDYQVQPIDLTARDTLRTASPVVVGDTAAIQDAVLETCNASLARSFVMPCSFTPGRLPPSSSPFFLLLALLTLTLSRRR